MKLSELIKFIGRSEMVRIGNNSKWVIRPVRVLENSPLLELEVERIISCPTGICIKVI